MTTYKATTPDGKTLTANSKRVYTHAIACHTDRSGWSIVRFCGSLELATKAASAQYNWLIKNKNTGVEVQVVEMVEA